MHVRALIIGVGCLVSSIGFAFMLARLLPDPPSFALGNAVEFLEVIAIFGGAYFSGYMSGHIAGRRQMLHGFIVGILTLLIVGTWIVLDAGGDLLALMYAGALLWVPVLSPLGGLAVRNRQTNKTEAKRIINQELEAYRGKPYSELVKMIDAEPVTYESTAPSGTLYQIEIQAFWDSKPNGDVRVMGCIDDGGWRAFFPISSDFIKKPDGQFVGE